MLAAHELGKRQAVSGAAIGALVIKPHLAVLAPFWLGAAGKWPAFMVAGVTATALVAISWAAFGSETIMAYTTSWRASGALLEGINPDFLRRMTTFYSQARLLGGDIAGLVLAVISGLAACAVALLASRRFGGDARAAGAAVLAATALASPYLFSYDLPFLIFPTLWLVMQGLEHGFRPYEKLALAVLYFAPYATRALAFPLGINLMPLAALTLLALVWSRGGKSGTGTSRAP